MNYGRFKASRKAHPVLEWGGRAWSSTRCSADIADWPHFQPCCSDISSLAVVCLDIPRPAVQPGRRRLAGSGWMDMYRSFIWRKSFLGKVTFRFISVPYPTIYCPIRPYLALSSPSPAPSAPIRPHRPLSGWSGFPYLQRAVQTYQFI